MHVTNYIVSSTYGFNDHHSIIEIPDLILLDGKS